MTVLRVASVSLCLLVGCALDEPAVAEQRSEIGGGCSIFGCGLNSPEVDHLGLHDLHVQVGGKRNVNGFYVTKIDKTVCSPGCVTTQYDYVRSTYGVLSAVSVASGTITGSAVQGLAIRIANAATGARYVLTIADVGRSVRLWADINPSVIESWPQYMIQWDVERGPGKQNEWKAVCTNPPQDGSPDLLGMSSFHSVVFEDDEIEAKSKVVVGQRAEKNWINIGCAGHTIAKMLLTGSTTPTDHKYGGHSSYEQKTAVLKTLSADYCGRGKPFTVAGQPLGFLTASGTNVYLPGFVGELEARFTSKGASCLNIPRILANPTLLGTATFPSLEAEIKAECGRLLPSCGVTDPYAMGGAYIVGANPL